MSFSTRLVRLNAWISVVLEVLIDVERVEVLAVEAGEEHVDDDSEVELFAALLRQVGVGELLVLDAFLNVLVVEVEFLDAVVGAEALVVVGNDRQERFFLTSGSCLLSSCSWGRSSWIC